MRSLTSKYSWTTKFPRPRISYQWDLRVFAADIIRYVAGGFADDDQISDDCIHRLAVGYKILEIHGADIVFYGPNGSDHVGYPEFPVPMRHGLIPSEYGPLKPYAAHPG